VCGGESLQETPPCSPRSLEPKDPATPLTEAEDSFSLDSVSNINLDSEKCWKFSTLDSKGIGVVATRDIKAGELILKECPIVIFPWAAISVVSQDDAVNSALPQMMLRHPEMVEALCREHQVGNVQELMRNIGLEHEQTARKIVELLPIEKK